MGGCLGFTIAGGVLEFIGLVLVAIEIWRIQHRVFGTPRMLVRLRDWTRRRLGKEGEVHHLELADALTMTDTASLRVQRGKATSLEGRIATLEKQHEDLVRELNEREDRLSKQIAQVAQQAADVRDELNRELAAREQSQRSLLRGTVTLQSVGTGFFFVGVVFSVLGNAVAC